MGVGGRVHMYVDPVAVRKPDARLFLDGCGARNPEPGLGRRRAIPFANPGHARPPPGRGGRSRLCGSAAHVRDPTPPDSLRRFSALTTRSGVIGISNTRTPIASAMAFAIAGATAVIAGSPMPLAP